jgi:excinuclease ABC, C subunit
MSGEKEILTEEQNYEQVREVVRMLPHVPGVYVFKDLNKKIIYIGKAKDLHKRVSSYFVNLEKQSAKTKVMVRQIAFLDFVIVNSEEEAFLLENNLIKENQPKYNILLKDDKSYPWVCITKEEYPRVFITRNYNPRRGKYYGPYTSSSGIQTILSTLKQLFHYRTCKYPMSHSQIENKKYRACLEYYIHNCKAPCINAISRSEYNKSIDCISSILKGKVASVINQLNTEYEDKIAKLEFEKAELLYNQICELREYQHKNSVLNPEVGDLDVITIKQKEKRIALNYMHVYNGAIVLSINRKVQNPLENSLEELLEVAIYRLHEEFASEADTLLTNITTPLSNSHYKNIEHPLRGDKHRVLLLSELNTERYLAQLEIQNKLPTEEAISSLQKILQLPKIPKRIECIDNSNTQGTYPVSSIVVFIDGVAAKDQYRIYNVNTVDGPNDYATMEEIVTRRYTNLPDEKLPDLLVIDGGKGQLSVVYKTLKKINLLSKIPIIGLAEKMEEIFVPRGTEPILLNKQSPALRLLIQMRDEAHRFGIKNHRIKRDKAVKYLLLENIVGIGEATIKKLYNFYGSIEKIKAVGKEGLKDIIGENKANLIWEYIEKTKNME